VNRQLKVAMATNDRFAQGIPLLVVADACTARAGSMWPAFAISVDEQF
jgi:hypothetical protein